MKKYVICKTHKINFTFFPATGVSAGILDLSLSVSLSERAISIRLIDYFVFASQFEYILRMWKLIFPSASLTYLSTTPAWSFLMNLFLPQTHSHTN